MQSITHYQFWDFVKHMYPLLATLILHHGSNVRQVQANKLQYKAKHPLHKTRTAPHLSQKHDTKQTLSDQHTIICIQLTLTIHANHNCEK